MPRRTPPSRGSQSRFTRRQVLAGTLLGVSGVSGAHALTNADAFTSGVTDRQSTVTVADGQQGVIGLLVFDSVRRNSRVQLVELTNNTETPVTTTVVLADCTTGTLYGPDGGSGCSVTFDLSRGETRRVEIETGEAAGTTIPFTITGDSTTTSFSFSMDRETTAESGQTQGSVSIERVQQFRARAPEDEWTVRRVTVVSDEYDLSRIEFRIREQSTGNLVASRDVTSVSGREYDARGQGSEPALRFQPSSTGYDVRTNITYELTVRAFDTEGNFDVERVTN